MRANAQTEAGSNRQLSAPLSVQKFLNIDLSEALSAV